MAEKNVPSIRLMRKDVELDDRTEEYILKRLGKLDRFCKKVLEYEVEISMDKKGRFTVEIMAKTPYNLYRVVETSESIEGSANMAVDEIKNQMVKDKDKIRDLRERGARSIKKKTVLSDDARFR